MNDIYAFRDNGRLILALTVNPISDPDFASTYAFDPGVLYRLAIDTDDDPAFERRISFVFDRPRTPGVQTFRARFPGGIQISGSTTPPSSPDDPVIVEDLMNGISIFAGPRDDPFFFDGVGFSRFNRSLDPADFRGIDSFATFNVSAIVVALPPELVSDGVSNLEISGFTFRRRGNGFRPQGPSLDRTGNPAVSSAFVAAGPRRDRFNRTLPRNDARVFGDEIVASLERFGTNPDNIALLASIALPDTLKLDLTQPDGFPNGRTPEDDVIDILASVIFNGDEPTGDGVPANDVPFLDVFPFFAPPQQPE